MKLNNVGHTLSQGLMLLGAATTVVAISGFQSVSNAARSGEVVTSDRGSSVNVRSAPSTQASIVNSAYAGDRFQILQQQQGSDGLWYQVQFARSGMAGWLRSDFVRFSIAQAPVSLPKTQAIVPPTATLPPAVKTSDIAFKEMPRSIGSQTSPNLRNRAVLSNPPYPVAVKRSPSTSPANLSRSAFTQEQINYFMEVAMGSEFDGGMGSPIRKWNGDIRVQVLGKPTSADLATVNALIQELNDLTEGAIRLQLVSDRPNMRIQFAPESQFRNLEPRYVPTNYGFFATTWNFNNVIQTANILITTQNVTQKERSHLIREEVTQSLGLMRDSFKYSKSIFYEPWTDVTQFAEIDKAIIRILYSPGIRAGMSKAEVASTLRTVQAAQSNPPLKF